jgi:hypothetical protein
MSEPGGIFDKTNGLKAFFTNILHVIVLGRMNEVYKKIVTESSFDELHSSRGKIETSIILKRFLFELLYTFTDLAYLAFVRLDIESLKKELVSIFTADEIRRVVTETIIPYFSKIKLK